MSDITIAPYAEVSLLFGRKGSKFAVHGTLEAIEALRRRLASDSDELDRVKRLARKAINNPDEWAVYVEKILTGGSA